MMDGLLLLSMTLIGWWNKEHCSRLENCSLVWRILISAKVHRWQGQDLAPAPWIHPALRQQSRLVEVDLGIVADLFFFFLTIYPSTNSNFHYNHVACLKEKVLNWFHEHDIKQELTGIHCRKAHLKKLLELHDAIMWLWTHDPESGKNVSKNL